MDKQVISSTNSSDEIPISIKMEADNQENATVFSWHMPELKQEKQTSFERGIELTKPGSQRKRNVELDENLSMAKQRIIESNTGKPILEERKPNVEKSIDNKNSKIYGSSLPTVQSAMKRLGDIDEAFLVMRKPDEGTRTLSEKTYQKLTNKLSKCEQRAPTRIVLSAGKETENNSSQEQPNENLEKNHHEICCALMKEFDDIKQGIYNVTAEKMKKLTVKGDQNVLQIFTSSKQDTDAPRVYSADKAASTANILENKSSKVKPKKNFENPSTHFDYSTNDSENGHEKYVLENKSSKIKPKNNFENPSTHFDYSTNDSENGHEKYVLENKSSKVKPKKNFENPSTHFDYSTNDSENGHEKYVLENKSSKIKPKTNFENPSTHFDYSTNDSENGHEKYVLENKSSKVKPKKNFENPSTHFDYSTNDSENGHEKYVLENKSSKVKPKNNFENPSTHFDYSTNDSENGHEKYVLENKSSKVKPKKNFENPSTHFDYSTNDSENGHEKYVLENKSSKVKPKKNFENPSTHFDYSTNDSENGHEKYVLENKSSKVKPKNNFENPSTHFDYSTNDSENGHEKYVLENKSSKVKPKNNFENPSTHFDYSTNDSENGHEKYVLENKSSKVKPKNNFENPSTHFDYSTNDSENGHEKYVLENNSSKVKPKKNFENPSTHFDYSTNDSENGHEKYVLENKSSKVKPKKNFENPSTHFDYSTNDSENGHEKYVLENKSSKVKPKNNFENPSTHFDYSTNDSENGHEKYVLENKSSKVKPKNNCENPSTHFDYSTNDSENGHEKYVLENKSSKIKPKTNFENPSTHFDYSTNDSENGHEKYVLENKSSKVKPDKSLENLSTYFDYRIYYSEYEIEYMAKLSPEQRIEDELNRRTCESFPQHLPCLKLQNNMEQSSVAGSLSALYKIHICRECQLRTLGQGSKDLLCRFYQFRCLQYKADGQLMVSGFLNPYKGPKQDDKKIWSPDDYTDPTVGNMDIQICRYILLYIGDQFCYFWRQEAEALKLHENKVDAIAWKKTIKGIRETCDVCDTTLFNYHWICGKCGFGVCLDCFKDRKDNQTIGKSKAKKNTETSHDEFHWLLCSGGECHQLKELMLTQIIPGDSLQKLGRLLHEIRTFWQIPQLCSCLLNEQTLPNGDLKGSVSALATEETLRNHEKLEQVHSKKLEKLSEIDPITSTFDIHFERKGLAGMRRFFPDRIMTLTSSTLIAPGVPHEWLCNGRLLRLTNANHADNRILFQQVWKCGRPIMISGVAKSLNLNLWQPETFLKEFGNQRNDLINCLNGNLVPNLPMSYFWQGFQCTKKRLLDEKGKAMLLKLKDWPPGDDFAEVLSTRYKDLIEGSPMPEYTLRTGHLNIASCLPKMFVPPDLGPKMYNAYGSAFHTDKGTTNLHLDISDAVNIMVYVGIPEDTNGKSQISAANKAIAKGGCDLLTIARLKNQNVLPGALWHIYSAADADNIRNFLKQIALEKGHRVESDHDPIHDQNWYLDHKLRARLYKEYGVQGYAIVQCLGDAVFIPAGAPHQVQNLHNCIKIAEDFVSPENITHCCHLAYEFRRLSHSHTNHEDKLQIKNIIYHAVKDCCTVLFRALEKHLQQKVVKKIDTKEKL